MLRVLSPNELKLTAMIKPNWDIFRAKFSNNPQDNFEWFCYSLFCREFKEEKGIFRFKNQSAIETEPIEKDGEVVGWQAKFYEVALSSKKGALIDTIEMAKRDYPNITKLLLYTNQEWGQTKGKPPQGLLDVEEKADELGIEIVWRTASFFESPFVASENEIISKHFFLLDKSILTQIDTQQEHTENILDDIETSVIFDEKAIEIDRESILEELKSNLYKIVILSGVGGVGKTAVIKKLFEQHKDKIPVYIFKATEFELRNINELLTNFDFQDFVDAHQNDNEKIVVIDSAEKLLFLKNMNPFKEFLRILIKSEWKIIFTTRNDYLEVLNTEFSEIHKIIPTNLKIENLRPEQLDSISNQYGFSLPKDEKLTELIRNPFYLNKYLKFYAKDVEVNYIHFKEKLWKEIVTKSKPAREQCFLKIALERARKGQFFINPSCESRILDEELKIDGILGYEAPHGYYITHDIYEEWALEKIIETEFIKREGNKEFFSQLGQSLPMRRSFRNWVSEKLLIESDSTKDFIEDVVKDKKIESFWKDEIIISVLLSDYADYFFDVCKEELLGNDQELLKRLTFLIRIACKEVDADVFSNFGFKKINLFSLEHVFTKPKGKGWESLIKFVFENLDQIGISNIYFILPIIYDWNNKNKDGETVRHTSLVALKYYQWLIEEDRFYSSDDTQNHLLTTIAYGAAEIETELRGILEKIVKNKWKNHRDPYYDLSKLILTKMEGLQVSQVLPGHVLRLADLFWYSPPKREKYYSYSGHGVDKYFNMKETLSEYFPASAYQTPTFWLLQSSFQETIDFIIQFTNKTVEAYASSDLDKGQVEEVEVFVEDGEPVKQYISNRLWCTYRGSQVLPHILESIHMALEKFFLERGKNSKPDALETWLLYLLKKSRSASISAVVTSIVLAFPDKTFNVAKVLFKTKDFFLYDTTRCVLEASHKGSLKILRRGFGTNYKNEIYENEREKACDDAHRKFALEQLCIKYQMFRTEDVSGEEAEKRQKAIWEILDKYYDQLPEKSKQNGADKTWRLYLARMDSRKMSPTTEKVDEGIAIQLNPEVDQELLEYSEKSIQKSSEPMKYTTLNLWAELKMRNDEGYKKYEKYENDPKLAFKEVEEIVSKLTGEEDSDVSGVQYSKDETFILMNASIPGNVCSVLVKYHLEVMTKEEQTLCNDIVMETASASLRPGYQYQIGDGSQFAISVLPILLDNFIEDRDVIIITLLLSLFDEYPIDMGSTGFNAFAIGAIHQLWETNFEDAQTLLLGYLLLKPKYEEFQERLRKEQIEKGEYGRSGNKEIDKFLSENEQVVSNILGNKVLIDDLEDIQGLDLGILKTAFLAIPPKTDNAEHKKIVRLIIPSFAERLLSRDRDERIDYEVRHNFLRKFAYFVLSSPGDEIEEYLKPFLDGFNGSEAVADLFQEFVLAEDSLNAYDNFWKVWGLFTDRVIGLCEKGERAWYVDKIIKSYLFAQVPWVDKITEWHSLKNANKRFFKEMSQKTGHCPSTLYSITKLLNDVGSIYLNEGISWVSFMLEKNLGLLDAELITNTIYYIENLARKYTYNNREEIKRSARAKKEVLVILDFLIEKGSVVGYMLRERIL
jgi:hypothetical protein